jgi:hypothetical protein
VVWELTGGGGKGRRGVRAAEEGLLGYLQQAERRGNPWFVEASSCLRRCSEAMARPRGSRGRRDVV